MVKLYVDKLVALVNKLKIESEISKSLEVKHFFSGAALYINETICVSWSPVGLAFKLPEHDVKKLIATGKAIPLKYFKKGHVKKDYALFENPDDKNSNKWKNYFILAATLVDSNYNDSKN